MSNKSRIYFTTLVAALAVIYAGFEWRDAWRLKGSEAAERAAIAELQRLLIQPRPRAPDQVTTEAAVMPKPATAAPTPPPDFGLQAKRKLSREARMAWGRQLLANHPEIRQLAVQINAAQFELMYRDFFRARGYSDEQIAALARRLADETGMESFWSDFGNFFLPLTSLSEDEAAQRRDAILHEMLGDTALKDFERFSSHWMAHAQVQHLAAMLVDTEQPLTKSEAGQIEAIFDRELETQDSMDPRNWAAILDGAQRLLSPAQMDALRLLNRQETVGVVK